MWKLVIKEQTFSWNCKKIPYNNYLSLSLVLQSYLVTVDASYISNLNQGTNCSHLFSFGFCIIISVAGFQANIIVTSKQNRKQIAVRVFNTVLAVSYIFKNIESALVQDRQKCNLFSRSGKEQTKLKL